MLHVTNDLTVNGNLRVDGHLIKKTKPTYTQLYYNVAPPGGSQTITLPTDMDNYDAFIYVSTDGSTTSDVTRTVHRVFVKTMKEWPATHKWGVGLETENTNPYIQYISDTQVRIHRGDNDGLMGLWAVRYNG